MKIGRNDYCPCGSQKKHKNCCLEGARVSRADEFRFQKYRDIEARLVARLLDNAEFVFGPSSLEEAWSEFYCWNEPGEYDPRSHMGQLFIPYYLYFWQIDSSELNCDSTFDGKTIAESFLSLKQGKLSKDEMEILQSLNRSPFSFYEVVDVTPGHEFMLRNILTETNYKVTERMGSQIARRGQVIFGALFKVDGRIKMHAMSPFFIPPLAIQAIAETRKTLQKEYETTKLTDAHLIESEFELRELYFSLLEPILNPQMPELCNTDGDPLLPQTLHFEISSPEGAFTALKDLATGMMNEQQLRNDAKIIDGKVYEAQIPWFKKSELAKPLLSNTISGTINIVGRKLTAEVNSTERAAALKQKIESALGADARYVTTVVESVEGNMGSNLRRNTLGSGGILLEQLPPEALEAMRNLSAAHWKKWLDEEIPALNNLTPRQAAKSNTGRELLNALLNSYEDNSIEEDNGATNFFKPDVQKLRGELGLTKNPES